MSLRLESFKSSNYLFVLKMLYLIILITWNRSIDLLWLQYSFFNILHSKTTFIFTMKSRGVVTEEHGKNQ